MHTLTIENISDDFLEPFLALAKAVKAKVITEKDDDEDWEREMEEALKEAKDILANPQNYPSYKTVDELWAALENDDEWEAEMEQALKESNDIIANPQNYPSYKSIAELRKALDEED